MKIRHKQSGVELEGDFVQWADVRLGMPLSIPHGGSCYAASEWEAVPEWVDVSGGVEVSADGEAMMGDGRVTLALSRWLPLPQGAASRQGYRPSRVSAGPSSWSARYDLE
jgi:hypothetical protein